MYEQFKPVIDGKEVPNNLDFINDLIQNHLKSVEYYDAATGYNYYQGCTDIANKKRTYPLRGTLQEDTTLANNKLTSFFLKTLVDQEVNYSLLNPVTITSDGDNVQQGILQACLETLGKRYNNNLRSVKKAATKQGKAWTYFYVDAVGNLKTTTYDPREIIGIYDSSTQKVLKGVLRFYKMHVQDDAGEMIERYRVEIYDTEKVTYLQESTNKKGCYEFLKVYDKSSEFYPQSMDPTIMCNPQYYWKTIKSFNGEVIETKFNSWPVIPFICLKNNEEALSTLRFTKSVIDAYENTNSEAQDLFSDITAQFYKFKNINITEQEIAELITRIKRNRGVALDEEQDLEIKDALIQYASHKERLEDLRRQVFEQGQGVDTQHSKFSNAPSGVSLEYQYELLKSKAIDAEAQIELYIENTLDLVSYYLTTKENRSRLDLNLVAIDFTAYKPVDEAGQLKANKEQMGAVSEKTRLSHHPWVQDVDKELEEMEKEDTALNTVINNMELEDEDE